MVSLVLVHIAKKLVVAQGALRGKVPCVPPRDGADRDRLWTVSVQ